MDRIYDFRSDTVTIPTFEMLEYMTQCKVGDDVKNEDPTVHKLQTTISNLCKKDSALFVCTGVMSNQLAFRTHVTFLSTQKEVVVQQVLCDFRSHVFQHELGGSSFHSQKSVLPINPLHYGKEYLTAEIIEEHLFEGNDLHTPNTTIISLENTLGGQILPIEEIKKIRELSNRKQIKMHLDGARLWNASVATGISLHEYAQYFDSVSLCLSKGLGAPIGSILVGNKEFIEKARQYRKLFGGGWRQAGILAGAALYAIENNWKRMKEDHENTLLLYQGLISLGFEAQIPHTNILFVDSRKLGIKWEEILKLIEITQKSSTERVLIEGEKYVARLVVHLQTPKEGIEKLISLMKLVLKQLLNQTV